MLSGFALEPPGAGARGDQAVLVPSPPAAPLRRRSGVEAFWSSLSHGCVNRFDPSGTIYPTPSYSLRKTMDPAIGPDALGPFDAILLSHDHHFNNLDHGGRILVDRTRPVFTTVAGASRLGGGAIGLVPWQSIEIAAPHGRVLTITGTPARHGPAHADRGSVTGFVLSFQDDPGNHIYPSGDTVWYEGVREVSQRCSVRAALLFMGAARVPAVGDWPLTLTASEGVEAAHAFSDATITMRVGSIFQNHVRRSR